MMDFDACECSINNIFFVFIKQIIRIKQIYLLYEKKLTS